MCWLLRLHGQCHQREVKKGIEGIMAGAQVRSLGLAKRLLLVSVVMAAPLGPILIGMLNDQVGGAQSVAAISSPPAFEVASVKPTDASEPRDFRIFPGGRLRVTNLTLELIIRQAFNVMHYQGSGGPRWLDTDGFDIDAKAEGDSTREQMMAMLRTLLGNRFQLNVHCETREGNVYTLAVANGGPKLKESIAQDSFIHLYRNTPPELPGVSYTIDGQKVSMGMLAGRLAEMEARPVLDRTGIKGEYDFKLNYAIDDNPETGPGIFSALREQLGLKLEASKGPVEILVIDHAERPTDN